MRMRRTMKSLVVLAFIATGLVLAQTHVWAHADYERSEPPKDAMLSEAPERVDVWFTQDVFRRAGQYHVRVFDAQDAQINDGDGTIDDDDRTHIFTALPSELPDGRYIVRWMTTSDVDGDTDDGAFCFYLGVEPTAEQEAECAAMGDDESTPAAATATETAATPTGSAETPTEAAATETPTVPVDGAGDDDDDTPVAVIVVIAVIGGVVLAAIVVGVGVWLRRAFA
jgi:methionine-rich copper-binding protein CopC